MENPDDNHDKNNKTVGVQENSANSIYNETIMSNKNEADALLKNLNDLSSNDSHLKRKREPESSFSIKDKHLTNKKEEGVNESFLLTCKICKIIEAPEKKQISCKICNSIFHIDCIIKVGRITMDNQVICNDCWQKENSNQFCNNNGIKYLNNFNTMNSHQLNSQNCPQNYPQNLNILNEMLKNSINRNMTANPSSNGQQAYNSNMNYFPAAQNNYQPSMKYNSQNSNMMNFLQNAQMQAPQMNPHQLMLLNQIMMNEKNDGQNPSLNSNNMQWNNPMMNSMFTKGNQNTNSNMNSNPDLIKANLLNQYLANLNKNKQIPSTQPGNFSNQFMNNNNFQDNLNINSKLPTNSQQGLNDSKQMPSQSNLLNLVTKQNNITHLNFFNNLFNISQMQSSNPHPMNTMYNNENISMNTMSNKNFNNTNYAHNENFPQGKTQYSKNNAASNLEFVGVNSYLNNLLTINSINNNKQDNKKLPIEDTLVFNNPEKYNIDRKFYKRQEPRPLKIPQKLQNKVFNIWDFFNSFKSFLDCENKFFVDKDFSGNVEEFYEKIIKEKPFLKLVLLLLNIYLMHSYPTDPTEFEFDKGLLFLRTLKENINSNLSLVSLNSWKEIFNIITDSKKFHLFVDDETLSIKQKLKKLSQKDESNFQFSIDEKVSILYFLVISSMDITKIKDLVKSESDKKNNLLREKVSLKLEYKNKDQRKKEIERSEKLLKADEQIQELTKKLEEIEQSNPVLSKFLMKQKKEIEIDRERYLSILKEYTEIENVKENIIERRRKIKNQLCEMIINNKRLIGQDVFKNNYYFFKNATNEIYVKKKNDGNSLQAFSNSKEKENMDSNKHSSWYCYDKKEVIQDILLKLVDKGIKERKLKHKLKKIFNKRMTFEGLDRQQMHELELNPTPMKDVDMIDQNNEQDANEDDLGLALEILKKMEDKFSEYLAQYSKQWEDKEKREKWREFITSFPSFDNLTSSLTMFAIRFKNPYRNDEPPLPEDEIVEEEKKQIKFHLKDSETHILLEVKAFDNAKFPASKVKIWSKDLETFDMEKYYCESILPFIKNKSEFYLALHFFESIIFNLIKRREALGKRNINLMREITDGNDMILNEIGNIEMSEEKSNKEVEIEKNISLEANKIANEDKTVSYSPDNEKTETIAINPSENNSEKKNKDEDKNENLKNKELIINDNKKINNINSNINKLKKKKRNATPKDLTMPDWKDTCYICLEYGDLVCCDACTNAAHLFCAYLDVK